MASDLWDLIVIDDLRAAAREERRMREAAEAERDALRKQTIAVCGGGVCGICYIKVPASIDSGTVLRCVTCNGEIVFDVDSPEARARMIAAMQRAADSLCTLLDLLPPSAPKEEG